MLNKVNKLAYQLVNFFQLEVTKQLPTASSKGKSFLVTEQNPRVKLVLSVFRGVTYMKRTPKETMPPQRYITPMFAYECAMIKHT